MFYISESPLPNYSFKGYFIVPWENWISFDKGCIIYGVKKSIVSVEIHHFLIAHGRSNVHVNENCLTFQIQSIGPIQPRLSSAN